MTNTFNNRVIAVKGEKIQSLLATDTAFLFLDKTVRTPEEFMELYSKTLTLVNKQEVKYDAVKNFKKETNDNEITISYKSTLGGSVTLECENPGDTEALLAYGVDHLGLSRQEVQLSPFRSARNYLIGLVIAFAATPFLYNRAAGIAAGAILDPEGYSKSDRKTRSLNNMLEMVGPNGVLIIGVIAIGVLGFLAWKRYQEPPVQIQLTRTSV